MFGKLMKIALKTATLPVNVVMDVTGVNLFTQTDWDGDGDCNGNEKSFFSTYDKMKSIAKDIEEIDE